MTHSFRTYLSLTLAMVLTAVLVSCKSTQQPVKPDYNKEQLPQWHDVYMPVKVSMSTPRSISLSGRATIVRDSVVNISMRILGMEVAALHCDKDSVWVVDKFHRYAFAGSKREILGSRDMPLERLQDIMLGIDSDGRDELTFTNPADGSTVTVRYSQRVKTPAGNAAAVISVDAPVNARRVDAALDWDFKAARWNTYRRVSFNRPGRGYQYFTPDDIIEMLKNF